MMMFAGSPVLPLARAIAWCAIVLAPRVLTAQETLPLPPDTAFSTAVVDALRDSSHPLPLRLVVSINQRKIWTVAGRDTVFSAPVSVAEGMTLSFAGQRWRFRTPRGGRRVLHKVVDPIWTPPDWHYAEVARAYGLHLATIPSRGVRLDDGSRLVTRHGVIGLVFPDGVFDEMPIDEHVVFGNRLYVPPVGTRNRRIAGQLGKFALDLGGGYMIHGTGNQAAVGQTSTHGCLRLRDEDLAWLYDHVPLGTQVVIR